MNISGVWSRTSAGTRAGSHTTKVGYGYLYEGAPYFFLNGSGDVGTWVHTDLTKTPTETPKVTEKPADTGAGKPADAQATREARKPRAAKAASEVSKKPRAPRKPKGGA